MWSERSLKRANSCCQREQSVNCKLYHPGLVAMAEGTVPRACSALAKRPLAQTNRC